MKAHAGRGLVPARVCLVSRKSLRILTERGERWARTGGALLHHATGLDALPAVGDWVAARVPPGDGEALVQALLPRATVLVRKVPGDQSAPHVLACNVDTVLIVVAVDEDFNARRLERYLTLAWESGARPAVVLNKIDLCSDPGPRVEAARRVAGDAHVHAVSAATGSNVDALRALFGPGRTVAVVGSSGAGKSTLLNRVAGQPLFAAGAVRDDGRGRHTTTRRELVPLPGGGAIVDTPGLRELQLWDSRAGLALAFDDVTALAASCRFADCAHAAEPGCAIRAALERGELEAARLASFRELSAELERLERPEGLRGRPATKRRERKGHGRR